MSEIPVDTSREEDGSEAVSKKEEIHNMVRM
jgi:hypothetical protein